MIPIKNKRKSLEVTIEEMRNFAFNYIEKFAPSKQQLKTYLLKKYLKSKTPVNRSNISSLIDIVLEDLEKSKFINDKFYSESKAKSLIQRGSSINKIRNYLVGKGVGEKYIKNTIEQIRENNDDQDFFSAIKICKKKRIGSDSGWNRVPVSGNNRNYKKNSEHLIKINKWIEYCNKRGATMYHDLNDEQTRLIEDGFNELVKIHNGLFDDLIKSHY